MINLRVYGILPLIVAITVVLLSGCEKYALKKDLAEIQQKAQETNQKIDERLTKIEQTPKADPVELVELKERLNNMSMYALELERRIHLQSEAISQTQLVPQMTLGVKTVSMEDVNGLVKKIEELNGKIKGIDMTRKVALNSVSFPLGKVRVEELSRTEFSKLKENSVRIMEEKPSTVEIVCWADGKGEQDTKEKTAGERARNVEAYYRENVGENGAKIKFLTVFKVASASGPFWRRADTTMWMPQEVK